MNNVGGQISDISPKACGRCCINWPIFIRLLERLIYFKVGKPQQEMTSEGENLKSFYAA